MKICLTSEESRFGRSILFITKRSADSYHLNVWRKWSIRTVHKEAQHLKYHQPVSDWYILHEICSIPTTGVMKTKLLAALSLLMVAGQLTANQFSCLHPDVSHASGTYILILANGILWERMLHMQICINLITLFPHSHCYFQVREECWVYTNIYTADYHQLHSLWWC